MQNAENTVECLKPVPTQYVTLPGGRCIATAGPRQGRTVDCGQCQQPSDMAHGIDQLEMLSAKRTCEAGMAIAFAAFLLMFLEVATIVVVQLVCMAQDPNPLSDSLGCDSGWCGGFFQGMAPDIVALVLYGFPRTCDVNSGGAVGSGKCGITQTDVDNRDRLAKLQALVVFLLVALGFLGFIMYFTTRRAYYNYIQGDWALQTIGAGKK